MVLFIIKDLGKLVLHPVDWTCNEEPETKLSSNNTVIIVSFSPLPPGCDAIVIPEGTVQIYAGAPNTFLIE